jgi:hypothetical protein
VQRRLAELGVQTPQSTQAEPADVAQDTAPPVKEGDMEEAANWRDPKYKDKLYTQEPNDSDEYDSISYGYDFPERPENDPGQKRRMGGVGSEYDRTDPLVKGFGRSGTGEPVSKGPRKGLPTRDQITSLKQSIKDVHGKHPRPNLPEGDNMATFVESNELTNMLKHAGVPVSEGVLKDDTGNTWDHLLDRFKHEVENFRQSGDLDDDLYDALYDYYHQHGAMPYKVAKARGGDPYEWISDRLAKDIGLDEGWKGALAGGLAGSALGSVVPGLGTVAGGLAGAYAGHKLGDEGFKDPDAAYNARQKQQQQQKPVSEGSCNMTMEGEYCPEHGLAECGGGMYEEDDAEVVMPLNMVEEVAFKSQEGDALLARIKSLALLR